MSFQLINLSKFSQFSVVLAISLLSPLTSSMVRASEPASATASTEIAIKNAPSTNSRVLSDTLNLVKHHEGFRNYAYIDTSGLPVIGYGQSRINGRRVRMGQYITRAAADKALEKELAHLQKIVRSHVKVDLNPYQLGALTSLVYNAGTRVLTHSTLVRKLNAGDYAGAAREFPRWNKANRGGRLVPFTGLTNRRLAEQKLFKTPVEQIVSNR